MNRREELQALFGIKSTKDFYYRHKNGYNHDYQGVLVRGTNGNPIRAEVNNSVGLLVKGDGLVLYDTFNGAFLIVEFEDYLDTTTSTVQYVVLGKGIKKAFEFRELSSLLKEEEKERATLCKEISDTLSRTDLEDLRKLRESLKNE